MVVTRQQARFRRLTNGRKYTFKVTAVNQVGKSTSEISAPCCPDEDITKENYGLRKKRIACKMKEKLLEQRKEQKQKKIRQQAQRHDSKRKKQVKKDRIQDKEHYNRILKHEQKKKRAAEKRKLKAEREQKEKRRKMEEQRQRVMMNKRRMSILAKDKINKLNGKIGIRPGRNLNTATSMMHVTGSKKKKRRGQHGQISKSGDHHGIRKEVQGSSPSSKKTKTNKVSSPKAVSSVGVAASSPKSGNQLRMVKSGAALLSSSEIEKLQKERARDEKKRKSSKRKSKKMNGDELDQEPSPRRKSSKKRLHNGKN